MCLQTSSTFSHNEQWLYDMSGRTGKKVDPTLFVSRIRCFEQSFPTVDLRYSSCSASMPQTFFDAHCLKAPFVYFLQCVSAKMLFMYLPASLMSYMPPLTVLHAQHYYPNLRTAFFERSRRCCSQNDALHQPPKGPPQGRVEPTILRITAIIELPHSTR